MSTKLKSNMPLYQYKQSNDEKEVFLAKTSLKQFIDFFYSLYQFLKEISSVLVYTNWPKVFQEFLERVDLFLSAIEKKIYNS